MSNPVTRVSRNVIAREGGFVDGERVEHEHAMFEFVPESVNADLAGGLLLMHFLHPDGKRDHSREPLVMNSPRLRRMRGMNIVFEGLVALRPDGTFSADEEETWDAVTYTMRREQWVQSVGLDRAAAMNKIVELSEQAAGGYE